MSIDVIDVKENKGLRKRIENWKGESDVGFRKMCDEIKKNGPVYFSLIKGGVYKIEKR